MQVIGRLGAPAIPPNRAAYRADERSAEVIQTLNDLGWISFLIGYVPFVTSGVGPRRWGR
jgi:hypothetical protein